MKKTFDLPVAGQAIPDQKPTFRQKIGKFWRAYLRLTRTSLHADLSHRDMPEGK